MAKLEPKTQVVMTATVELSQEEIDALAAVVNYGENAIIRAFSTISEDLVSKHGPALRSFFGSMAAPAKLLSSRRRDMMQVFAGTHKAVKLEEPDARKPVTLG